MKRILLVEDEASISKLLRFNFEREGYFVLLAEDGEAAVEIFKSTDPPFDLIVLDLMLPKLSGYEACREIRKISPSVPILALSARTLSEDKAQAFDCGMDQYMTKPFALPELLSRVRNLLERRPRVEGSGSALREAAQVFRFSNVEVDFSRFELRRNGEKHTLTTRECELLRYFVEHDGVVLSRMRLQESVWRDSVDMPGRSIDNFVMRLRRMIEADPSNPKHLLSVRGTGYRFLAEPTGSEEV